MINSLAPDVARDINTSINLYNCKTKKPSKIYCVLVGVSSIMFLSNIDTSNSSEQLFINNDTVLRLTNCVEENAPMNRILSSKKRMIAKLKKQYSPTDEELAEKLTAKDMILCNNIDIENFIKHNSGRLISSLDKWL